MTTEIITPIVTTEWLAKHLSAPDVRVIDASWYLAPAGRNAWAEYDDAHIPGAVFFDIDEISDTSSTLPHMMPDPAKFASRVKALGLGDGARLVVYDGSGLFSAARVWWMFRAMGHKAISVLDGGFPKWTREGRPVDDHRPIRTSRHFTPRPNHMLIRGLSQMKYNLESKAEQVMDARSPGRFHAQEPEPRPGLRGGHIPGSKNVYYARLLNPDGTMRSPDSIRQAFKDAGIDVQAPVVASCGSGVSAAILLLGLAVIGAPDGALYDGAWAEWGGDTSLPAAT